GQREVTTKVCDAGPRRYDFAVPLDRNGVGLVIAPGAIEVGDDSAGRVEARVQDAVRRVPGQGEVRSVAIGEGDTPGHDLAVGLDRCTECLVIAAQAVEIRQDRTDRVEARVQGAVWRVPGEGKVVRGGSRPC